MQIERVTALLKPFQWTTREMNGNRGNRNAGGAGNEERGTWRGRQSQRARGLGPDQRRAGGPAGEARAESIFPAGHTLQLPCSPSLGHSGPDPAWMPRFVAAVRRERARGWADLPCRRTVCWAGRREQGLVPVTPQPVSLYLGRGRVGSAFKGWFHPVREERG